MTEPAASGVPHHWPPVVVHHVVEASPPFRHVDILGTQVGKAHNVRDVVEFCRRAGLGEVDLDAEDTVQWIGGGPEVWE
ncbi:hypothetical protein ABH931_004705 [Streptacidiphilus sp. MAP12-33]|uniref:hypothetical protein n=1 Tax=Streptacidiphilus sp. MAP12-33 TaxID=3156266 RepID=UPI003517B79A